MGDEYQGQTELINEVGDEIQNLSSNGDVKGRDSFVGDQHRWSWGKSSRDGDPLALSSGELMRIERLGIGSEANRPQEFLHSQLRISGHTESPQWFLDRCTDREARIQGTKRVLKDDLYLLAEVEQRLTFCGEWLTHEEEFTGAWRIEGYQEPRECRFA